MDLPEFLLARAAEREKVAEAANARVRRWAKDIRPPWIRAREDADYIGRHAALERFEGRETPDDVLAWCAALRTIVKLAHEIDEETGLRFGDDLLEALAQPFAAHPDFDPAWQAVQASP